jgi:hypothetical protein
MQLSRRRLAQKLRFPDDCSQDLQYQISSKRDICAVMLGHGQANGKTDRQGVQSTLVNNTWSCEVKTIFVLL